MDGPAWWRNPDRSGGQIFEQVIHLYNLATSLLGDPVEVTGHMANLLHGNDPDYGIEDTSAGLIRFANGALACITGSNCAAEEHFFADFQVACERVTLDYRCTGQPWVEPDVATWYRGGQGERIDETADVHAAAAEDFVLAIRSGGPARCPLNEGVRDLRLLHRLIESARQDGQPMELA
jgi:predicted dehydrogenase